MAEQQGFELDPIWDPVKQQKLLESYRALTRMAERLLERRI
ncbi:MAG: hypothetical protein WC314_03840 [Vulcanimicrobiota bacterium]